MPDDKIDPRRRLSPHYVAGCGIIGAILLVVIGIAAYAILWALGDGLNGI